MWLKIGTVTSLALVLCGCSSNLSRSRVKKILLEQPLFKDPVATAPWRDGGYDEWVRRGGMNSPKLATGIFAARWDWTDIRDPCLQNH
jgi:hypothetical protein